MSDVAPGHGQPLVIQTRSGIVYSDGGRLGLRELPERSRVVTLQGHARLAPGASPPVLLHVGLVTWFDPRGVVGQTPMGAWKRPGCKAGWWRTTTRCLAWSKPCERITKGGCGLTLLSRNCG